MSWDSIKRWFNKNPRARAPEGDVARKDPPDCPWLGAAENPWGVPVLDVRPVTLAMISVSKDPSCASNAASFGNDDGTGFIGVKPESGRETATSLRYNIDRHLADGVLFAPDRMEHKWALFLHRGRVIFVRSWLRKVAAAADLEVSGGHATITRIMGVLAGDEEEPAFTVRCADYLIRSHCLGQAYPAPLPPGMEAVPSAAALWCMSAFGSMALFATPHPLDVPPPATPLRTDSLLHIAVARRDAPAARAQLDARIPADLLARDGLAPLHWSVGQPDTAMAELLLGRGSPADARSAEGATPLMNAVQAKSAAWVAFLLARGADPNARDNRGFTALHRAAEMGQADVVRRLLDTGARADMEAQGHTPLSLARGRGHDSIADLLLRR